jgi:SAM-dependent methyltransferase
MELFGRSIPLREFPRAKHIRGVGLSDALLFSETFTERFSYQNTCYHREPRLDISTLTKTPDLAYDFVIASEVFEHVPPPVQVAFDNLARLLKPNGIAIFSSPWESTGESVEHFPDLHDWQVVTLSSGYVLVNRTSDGRLQACDELVFHGGPGNTLEMRVFSRDGLLANCTAAGFEVDFAEDNAASGIIWEPWSRGMILRKRAHS